VIITPLTGISVSMDTILLSHTRTITQGANHETSDYQLLILAPAHFADELEPLVVHKENMGIPTNLVTLEEIYQEMKQGRDKAEQIKYFIKTAIEEQSIQNVLLVGGKKGQLPVWYLPVRYVHMDNNWEPHYISDLYYADIYDQHGGFSSWDADGDGVYGEWRRGDYPEDPDINLNPDIAVGRLPCRNQLEVKIMVDKIIDYELNTFGQAWFTKMVVIAGDTYPEHHNPNWTGYEGELYGDEALNYMDDFTPIQLYTSDKTFTGPSDVITTVNQGCGFLYFVGHGNPMTWGNHPPDDDDFITGLSVYHMPQLKNKGEYPVCVVSGCHNCQFDVSIFNFFDKIKRYWGEFTPECWGWWITRNLGGGSIATIGCTALGHTKEDKDSFQGGINELEVEFFRQYGENNIETLGDVWLAALTWYLDTYPADWDTQAVSDSWVDVQVVQTWILFGDPTLRIGGYPENPSP
jgi:hypothetical protein